MAKRIVQVKLTDVRAGDRALHRRQLLDSRTVTRVGETPGQTWVYLQLETTEAGPFPLENYTYTREEQS